MWPQLKDACPLKDEIVGNGLDILVVRELTGGIYFGERGTSADGKTAWDTEKYSWEEIERIVRLGFQFAVNDFGSYENEAMLRYLLDNKFDYSLRDVYGSSPVDLAKNQKSKTNIKILQSYDIPGTDLSSVKISNDANEEVFDGVYPYEKDTEDFFEMKKKEAPLEKRKRRPNLADYKEEHFELYHDESGYWDASGRKQSILAFGDMCARRGIMNMALRHHTTTKRLICI